MIYRDVKNGWFEARDEKDDIISREGIISLVRNDIDRYLERNSK